MKFQLWQGGRRKKSEDKNKWHKHTQTLTHPRTRACQLWIWRGIRLSLSHALLFSLGLSVSVRRQSRGPGKTVPDGLGARKGQMLN